MADVSISHRTKGFMFNSDKGSLLEEFWDESGQEGMLSSLSCNVPCFNLKRRQNKYDKISNAINSGL